MFRQSRLTSLASILDSSLNFSEPDAVSGDWRLCSPGRNSRARLRASQPRYLRPAIIASQIFVGAPVLAQDAARAGVHAATRAAADAQRKLAKASVRVNRTVPKVSPPNIDPMFGMNVTTEALMRARFFPEQLIPTSAPSADDNHALARMLERVAIAPRDRQIAVIDEHIHQNPASAWRASLLATAGTLYSREGYFTRAASYWTQAWELTRASDDSKVRVLADYALGESVEQMVKFGQVEKLEARLKEADGRDVRGPAGTKVSDGWEGLALLREKHHLAIFSGPEALKTFLTVRPIDNLERAIKTIGDYHPAVAGTTMTELKTLAASVGLELSMWRASPGRCRDRPRRSPMTATAAWTASKGRTAIWSSSPTTAWIG